ncbi:MAG: hypothetical protein J6T98_12065 [Salinivirgaceae bacterium]|nr:hypothetical protein [Salinivirgaceae bacterium]
MLFLFFIGAATTAQAQYYDSGQDRFRRLSYIKTEHFDVIFPQSESRLGQLYANNLEQAYSNGCKSLNWRPRRVPAALFPSSGYANGEVAWAPRRMNLLTMASPDNYQQAWNQQLSLHEFRHVVQSDMLRQGASRFFSALLGEQYTGLILGLHVPYWFLEGDAVAYETGASLSGRGRTGDFTNQLAAQVAQKGAFSYPKAMFGSYADKVPTRYHLGYQLISYGRLHYGEEIWQNAMNCVARHPIALRPFGRGIKQTTGLKEDEFYKAALEPLRLGPKNAAPANMNLITNPTPNDYDSYSLPQSLPNGNIVTYREQLSDIPSFVMIDTATKRIKKITRPGPMIVNHHSVSGNMLIWNQLRYTRWEHLSHSQIVAYDMERHRKHTIISRGRYYCSTLSHTATQIASICYTDSALWSIVIHDTNGKLVSTFQTGTSVPVRIAWSDDDKQLAYITIESNWKSVAIINMATMTADTILPRVDDDISNLLFSNNRLFMTGNRTGNIAWFSYNLIDSTFNVVAESPFGVGGGSVNGNQLLFSYHTANGYQIAETQIDSTTSSTPPTSNTTDLTCALASQEKLVTFDNDSVYKIQHYNRLGHLLNFHSWGPFSVRIDESEISPGLTFMSQDALSTSFLTAGYQWLNTESKDDYFLEYRYKGFFPIIGMRGDIYKFKTLQETNSGDITLNVLRKRGMAFMQVPMTFKTSVFTTGLTLQASYQIIRTQFTYKRQEYDTTDHTAGYSIYFYSLRRTAHRDLQSRIGIAVKADYYHYLTNAENHQTALQAWLYLPGLIARRTNQGLSLYCGLQERNRSNLVFNNLIQISRGYKTVDNTQLLCLQASYAMPLFYPDWNVANILYIKRIKAKMFYDNTWADNSGKHTRLESSGCDFTADFHIYRFAVPISAGVRYARRMSLDDNYFGMLLSMNFNGIMGK